MHFGVVSLFPDMFAALQFGVLGRALTDERIRLTHWNPRQFALDNYKTVDDYPYGGGPGLVMKPEPLISAIRAAKFSLPEAQVVYLSPQGKRFDQAAAQTFSKDSSLILVAGRYEGIDQRVIDLTIDAEWSLGDYILSGGEIAAMAMIDAIARLVPGVVGDADSVSQDTFSAGLLKYPQYTRPESIEGMKVPEVLLSGNHRDIENWRLKMSLGQTWLKRPDLLQVKSLTKTEAALLQEFIEENAENAK